MTVRMGGGEERMGVDGRDVPVGDSTRGVNPDGGRRSCGEQPRTRMKMERRTRRQEFFVFIPLYSSKFPVSEETISHSTLPIIY